MAKKSPHVSIRPSKAEKGGNFGFPPGVTVTIIEARFATWDEAGENALKGGRDPEDPALILVGEMEDVDEPRTVFLGAGKKNRLVPSDDGEHLDLAEGSAAQGISESCNTNVFLESLVDKKAHGSKALPEEQLDKGISNIVGLVFVAGAKMIERVGLEMEEGRKARPSLIAETIVKLPKGTGKKKAAEEEEEEEQEAKPKKKPAKKRPAEEEEEEAEAEAEEEAEEDETDADDVDVPEAVEEAIVAALDTAKYRKGILVKNAFTAVFNQTKDHPAKKEIIGFVKMAEFDKWSRSSKRPWTVDDDNMIQSVS